MGEDSEIVAESIKPVDIGLRSMQAGLWMIVTGLIPFMAAWSIGGDISLSLIIGYSIFIIFWILIIRSIISNIRVAGVCEEGALAISITKLIFLDAILGLAYLMNESVAVSGNDFLGMLTMHLLFLPPIIAYYLISLLALGTISRAFVISSFIFMAQTLYITYSYFYR